MHRSHAMRILFDSAVEQFEAMAFTLHSPQSMTLRHVKPSPTERLSSTTNLLGRKAGIPAFGSTASFKLWFIMPLIAVERRSGSEVHVTGSKTGHRLSLQRSAWMIPLLESNEGALRSPSEMFKLQRHSYKCAITGLHDLRFSGYAGDPKDVTFLQAFSQYLSVDTTFDILENYASMPMSETRTKSSIIVKHKGWILRTSGFGEFLDEVLRKHDNAGGSGAVPTGHDFIGLVTMQQLRASVAELALYVAPVA
ncbi:hypothetical protein BKA93DRAFT_750732 [Sparassis latifolia]